MAEIKGMTLRGYMTGKRQSVEVLAHFDVALSEVVMHGCALVRFGNGKVTTWPPRLDNLRRVTFASESLKRDVTAQAQEVYRALGGD